MIRTTLPATALLVTILAPMGALAAPAPAWTVDRAASRLTFTSSFNDERFSGAFTRWGADIRFDPKNLPGSSVWVDAHYFKGMHRSLPAANVARRVPILSGACLMIDRRLYEDFGGLSGVFVQGDYEDSDLCLKLSQKGYENWYAPVAELYHLEGQSYESGLRMNAWRYNAWLHTHMWGDRIQKLMSEFNGEPTSNGALPSLQVAELAPIVPMKSDAVEVKAL